MHPKQHPTQQHFTQWHYLKWHLVRSVIASKFLEPFDLRSMVTALASHSNVWVQRPVVKLFLFRSCPIVGRTLWPYFHFKLTLSGYLDLCLCILPSCLFMMLCIVIYYKYSLISNNKHELIQVVVAANVTTQKSLMLPKRHQVQQHYTQWRYLKRHQVQQHYTQWRYLKWPSVQSVILLNIVETFLILDQWSLR